ncbi:OTU domain-containing protein 4 [Merluccius polli]|uniref:ubiquitinyl hydrolase 1 n=1 Tax=Merluccius polli TaxID=89951 RepID=A0AA47MRV9_MERPO|nr:OTU domain-containing protein 4 [Merluccius polli]
MPARSKKSKAAKRRCAEGGPIAVDLGSAAELALTRKKQVAEFALTRDKEVAEFALPRKKQVAEAVLPRKIQVTAKLSSDAELAKLVTLSSDAELATLSLDAKLANDLPTTCQYTSSDSDYLPITCQYMSSDSYFAKTVPIDPNPPSSTVTYMTESNATDDCLIQPVDRSVLMGSFHQGHSQFGKERNKQCGAISLTAVLKSKVSDVWTWLSRDLDDVLIKGTVLYRSMRAQGKIRDQGRGYIAVSELPRHYKVWNCNFAINYAESYSGLISVDDYDQSLRDVAMPFDEALQRSLYCNDACLLTICANTYAIVNGGGKFAFVDSHTNENVNRKGERVSCVAYFNSVETLCRHVYDFAQSFGVSTPRFEVTGVKAAISHVDLDDANRSPMVSSQLYSDIVKGKRRQRVKTETKSQVNDVIDVDANTAARPLDSEDLKRGHCSDQGKQRQCVKRVKTEIKSHMNDVIDVDADTAKESFQSQCGLVATDDVIISEVTVAKRTFKPLTREDQDVLCKKIGLSTVHSDEKPKTMSSVDDMGCPCKIQSIKPDGNCFYRSLAWSICRDENQHLKVRRAVVKHLQKNSNDFESYLRDEYTSVPDYVTKSRVYYCGSWAKEIDIFAAADLLQTAIVTFNDGRWNVHAPIAGPQSENCIYLNHTGNHYEVITCVQHRNAASVCAGTCQPTNNDGNFRSLRKRKSEAEPENVKAKKERRNYRKRHVEKSKARYKTNSRFQTLVRTYSKAKYKTNSRFQTLVRTYSKAKYKTNRRFQTLVRKYSKTKYMSNKNFQTHVHGYSHMKYKRNTLFRNKMNQENKSKYRSNQREVSRGSEYVCAVCHRLLFRKQVLECKTQCYERKGAEVATFANRCITLQYLHICDMECEQECHLSNSPSSKLWICHTCHRKILGGKLPEESVANSMHLSEIPAELKCLNSLEQHLIARHIPFMKLLCLPRGRQRACHGPCVSVPINNTDVTNILPRNECDDKMIRVKLKRKLTYKGHYEYMFVHTDRVRNALRYLLVNNKWCDDVTLNDEWVNTLNGTDQLDAEENSRQEPADNSDDENTHAEQEEEDLTYIKDQGGLLSDTSLQPVDLGT